MSVHSPMIENVGRYNGCKERPNVLFTKRPSRCVPMATAMQFTLREPLEPSQNTLLNTKLLNPVGMTSSVTHASPMGDICCLYSNKKKYF